MLERFTQSFSQLKNSISLRYIDVNLRDRSDEILELMRQWMPQSEVCRNYINKIEEVHESFLQSISAFIDSFPHYVAQYQQSFEAMQHELALASKLYEEERREWQVKLKIIQSNMQEMNDKIERSHRQIMAKEEEIRWFSLKLEERQGFIEQLERQSNDYLKKVETDMERQQKALEQSCFIVTKLQEEVESLKYQNERLLQAKQANNTIVINNCEANIVNMAQLQINQSISNSSSPRSYVRCSIASNSEHGLSQFQQVQHSNQREVLDSIDCNIELPPKCETLKEMLNMSVEKQYKLQYNKCDSIEYKLSKDNYKFELRDDLAKQNNEMWGVNNSLEFISKDNRRMPVKQFNLPAKDDNKRNNPYYFYFVIASQNAKINSQHFEQICTLSTQSQWQLLNTSKTPLHEWQSHLRNYLLKQAKII